MMKYVIAALVFVAVLAGLLLFVGDDATLLFTSSAQTGALAFPPIEVTWQAFILLGAASVVGIIAAWSILLWLYRLPRRLKSGVGMRKRNRAIDAMEEALIAGAEGDADRARKASAQVRKLAGSTDLGHIISATAAEASGDVEEAAIHYEAMLDSPKTRPTGQRGIAQTKLATGDLPGAVEAATEAFDANPRARWAFDTLFKALVADFRWTEARDVLEKGRAAKHIDNDVLRRRRAVLSAAEADYWMDSGQHDKALDLAQSALKDAPDFAPAAAIAAHELTRQGGQKKAAKLLEEAWERSPHPALSTAYLDLYPGESLTTQGKRIRRFADLAPGHRESKLLLAAHQLRAGKTVEAWSALSPMVADGKPTARLCLMASEAERALGNDRDARLWLERAATAPHELDWSDLDPEGPGFAYTAQDWRRLVFSYGDTGQLEHPRAERQEEVRRPTPEPDLTEPSQAKPVPSEPAVAATVPVVAPKDTTPQPAPIPVVKPDADLSDRLDQLLDGKPE